MRTFVHWVLHFMASHPSIQIVLVFFEACGVLAVVLAWLHGLELSKALRKLDQITTDLTTAREDLIVMSETLPTRAVGPFPGFVKTIANNIGKATDRIIICCDNPAYGSFSNAEAFQQYRVSLISKIHIEPTPKVMFFCCRDTDGRRESTTQQFSRYKHHGEWVKFRTVNRKRLENYLALHPDGKHHSADSLSHDAFVKLIIHEDTAFLDEIKACKPIELPELPPMYFWLIDDEMVFAIPTEISRAESGFITRDPNLISGILDVSRRGTGIAFPSAS
jgi:hypothetical protein